jgi:hypothetical protein
VLHADCSDVDEFVDMLRPLYDGEIVVGEIGPVIGTHAGRGTIGVAFHEPDDHDHPSDRPLRMTARNDVGAPVAPLA